MSSRGVTFTIRSLAWAVPLAAIWWIVAEGRPGSWGVGVPVVAAAAAVAARIVPPSPRRVRPGAALRFAGYFVVQSARGGLDVARRALSPSMPIAPRLAELRTRLPEGAPRVLLADALSLLPGTLTVELDGDRLVVHALAGGAGIEDEVRALERRVEELLGLATAPPEAP